MSNKKYYIAISHAGKDSKYISSTVDQLRSSLPSDKYEIFYDKNNYVDIEGASNLSAYLRDVFLNKADFIIVFASQNYIEGKYAQMEFNHIWGRYKNNPSKENIVWITCDGVVPDKLKNENSLPIDMRERSDDEILNNICHKIKKSQGQNSHLFNDVNKKDENASIRSDRKDNDVPSTRILKDGEVSKSNVEIIKNLPKILKKGNVASLNISFKDINGDYYYDSVNESAGHNNVFEDSVNIHTENTGNEDE